MEKLNMKIMRTIIENCNDVKSLTKITQNLDKEFKLLTNFCETDEEFKFLKKLYTQTTQQLIKIIIINKNKEKALIKQIETLKHKNKQLNNIVKQILFEE